MDRRFYSLIGILFFGIFLTIVFKPAEIDSGRDERVMSIPKILGEYTSKDVKLDEDVYDMLETKNVIMRDYRKKNEPPIIFYLIFSKKTHKTSDPPENCLRGEDRVIINKGLVEFPEFNLSANKLIAEKDGVKELYLYWFIAGNKFYKGYFKQRLELILSYLKRAPKCGGQIRISTQIIDSNEQDALQRMEDFIALILPHLKQLLT